MIDAGFFARDDRYELLQGLIVRRPRPDPARDSCLSLLRRLLDDRIPPDWHARVRCGFTTDDSEPEPDVVVARGQPLDYTLRHPGPADAALIVEVANNAAEHDREWMGEIYAAAGVPVYWLVSIADGRVEVYTDPTGPDSMPAYRRRDDLRPGHSLVTAVGGTTVDPIRIDDLLPERLLNAAGRSS